MTHSLYLQDPDGNGVELVYDLPSEVWEGDVNVALNYFDYLSNEGDEALEDTTDYKSSARPTPKRQVQFDKKVPPTAGGLATLLHNVTPSSSVGLLGSFRG
jgi:hypothetical protein